MEMQAAATLRLPLSAPVTRACAAHAELATVAVMLSRSVHAFASLGGVGGGGRDDPTSAALAGQVLGMVAGSACPSEAPPNGAGSVLGDELLLLLVLSIEAAYSAGPQQPLSVDAAAVRLHPGGYAGRCLQLLARALSGEAGVGGGDGSSGSGGGGSGGVAGSSSWGGGGVDPPVLPSERVAGWLEAWLCTSPAVAAPAWTVDAPGGGGDAAGVSRGLEGGLVGGGVGESGAPTVGGVPAATPTLGRALLVGMHEALYRQLRREQN
jgi:hypothetical protein